MNLSDIFKITIEHGKDQELVEHWDIYLPDSGGFKKISAHGGRTESVKKATVEQALDAINNPNYYMTEVKVSPGIYVTYKRREK